MQYCGKYGRLYTYEASQAVCKSIGIDWHLPSTSEWTNLISHYGGIYKDSIQNGKKAYAYLLKTGTKDFQAHLGGNKNLDGTYGRLHAHGFYWTSSEINDQQSGFLNFAKGRGTLFLQPDMEKIRALSVRCIKQK